MDEVGLIPHEPPTLIESFVDNIKDKEQRQMESMGKLGFCIGGAARGIYRKHESCTTSHGAATGTMQTAAPAVVVAAKPPVTAAVTEPAKPAVTGGQSHFLKYIRDNFPEPKVAPAVAVPAKPEVGSNQPSAQEIAAKLRA